MVRHEIGGGDTQICRDAHRQRGQRVHRRAERHDAGDVFGTPIGRGLVAEHAALRIPDQVHIAAGGVLDGVDRLTERDNVVGQVAAHAAFDLVGRAEVDDPRVEPAGVQDPYRTLLAGYVPHVRGHHHRVHHQHGRPHGPAFRRKIPPQLVHRHALDDLRRRRNAPGLQAPQPKDFQAVLRRGHQTLDRSCDHRKIQIHRCSLTLDSLVIMAHRPVLWRWSGSLLKRCVVGRDRTNAPVASARWRTCWEPRRYTSNTRINWYSTPSRSASMTARGSASSDATETASPACSRC